jgi:single-stranded DNA-binding protein
LQGIHRSPAARLESEDTMSVVQIIQRNAHLAGAVRLDHVKSSDGQGSSLARASFTALSNPRRSRSDDRTDEPTAIRWTLWGRLAENAAQYLGKGSHVNVVGHVRCDSYTAADGSTAHAMAFTAEEVDYLDTRAEGQARRERQAFVDDMAAAEPSTPAVRSAAAQRGRQA